MNKTYFLPSSSKWVLVLMIALVLGCQLQETEFIQPVPIALDASNVTSTSFTASWKPVLGSTIYLVDVSSDPQFSNFVTGYQSREVIGTTLQVTNLEVEKQYYYRVRARKGNTFSSNSNVVLVSSALLTAPVAASASNNKVFQFTANWSMIEEAASYLIDVASDSTFTTILPAYKGKEIVSNSLSVEGLDYRKTYYYRVKAKRLEKTSAYSNAMEVKPVISPTCKLSKITFDESSFVQLNYNTQGRLIELVETLYGDEYPYKFAYNSKGKASEVTLYDTDGLLIQTQKLAYNPQGMLATVSVYDSDNELEVLNEIIYSAQQQVIGIKKYSDAAKTLLVSSFDYELDATGNVLRILNQSKREVAKFRYDDKFNPRMLLPEELRQYASDTFTATAERPYLQLNNFTYGQLTTYFNGQEIKYNEVFIYDYNDKDIAIKRNGYYSLSYEFVGCDF